MSTSVVAYLAVVLVVAATRLGELVVAHRHLAWARTRGGIEHGSGHYPVMVALHAGLLVGCVVEVSTGGRLFLPWLGWPMLVLLVAAYGLRWWCIWALGRRWTTRVVVIPGLPLVHSAWLTALVFTVANLALLRVRIRVEQAALVAAAPRRATTVVC